MTTRIHHVPEGLPGLIPHVVCVDARKLAAFADKAFGARLEGTMLGPDGKGVMIGYLRLAGSTMFVSDASESQKPTCASLFIYVPDVDAAVARAVDAGARVVTPVSDMFWGDRWGVIADPLGNVWQVATHTENVTPEEMQARLAEMAPR